ncbi:uncharacterized protein BDFB_007011, partial [Asbolus verrucosus]
MPTLSSNFSADDSIEKWKVPYLDIIAVGIMQFLLSLLLLCYGVILMQFVLEDFYNLRTGLWTVIIFVAASKITNPWTKSYCKHLDNIRHKVHKRNIIITVILLFGELVTVSLVNTPSTQIILYGLFGGLLSAVIHVHAKFATNEIFKNRPQLFEAIDQIMKPLCLIFMPHLVLFLTDQYNTPNCQLIIGGLILNIIPVCLLITTRKYQKMPLSKFQTIDRLSMEMVDLNPKPSISESSSSDEDEEIELELNISEPVQTEPSTNVQIYYQNVGVKILPNIPEANESEDEDDINEISSKRLSKISAILQELNETNNKHVTLSVNNLYQPDEVVETVETNENGATDFVEDHSKENRRFRINSDTIYALKLKKRRIKTFLRNHFVRSFLRTLSKPCFYPAVISSVITTTLSTIILAATPYIMLKKNEYRNNSITTVDATFLLTIIGFTWTFFLAGYPIFIVAQKFSYDNFTLFSLMFGLGHGIVNYTESIACEHFFGKENWKKLQAALEISTGFIVILIYFIIYYSSLEINVLLSYAYWPYVFNVSLWIVAFIIKQIVVQVKNFRRYNRQRYPDFNF